MEPIDPVTVAGGYLEESGAVCHNTGMKQKKQVLALAAALVAATVWGSFARSVHAPAPWHNPDALNVGGVRLGMEADELRRLALPMSGVQYDEGRHVKFVAGFELSEGKTVLARSDQGINLVVQEMGTPFASGQEESSQIHCYRAGHHWVILRYTNPSIAARMASVPQFALATDIDSIEAQHWGKAILQRALALK